MTTTNIGSIDLSDVGFILNNKQGKQVLFKINVNGFVMKTFSKLDYVDVYTDKIEIEFQNVSTVEIAENEVAKIEYHQDITKQGTRIITIEMKDNKSVYIEFEA